MCAPRRRRLVAGERQNAQHHRLAVRPVCGVHAADAGLMQEPALDPEGTDP
jgi:hypothetical protein